MGTVPPSNWKTQRPWYTYPRIDNFGTKDPDGNYWKPDSNIQIPQGYPITELLGGTVTSITGTYGNVGAILITVKLDHPLNDVATHEAYEWCKNVFVRVGQHVSPGDLLATNGGAEWNATLGYGLSSTDVFNTGWDQLQRDLAPGGPNKLNPVALLNSARDGKLQAYLNSIGSSIGSGSGTGAGSGGGAVPSIFSSFNLTSVQVHDYLNNIAGFGGIVIALDKVEQFQPFSLAERANSGGSDTTGNIIGIINAAPGGNFVTQAANGVASAVNSNVLQLPADAMQAVLVFITANSLAFSIRALLVMIGLLLLIAVSINIMSDLGGQISENPILSTATKAIAV